MMPRLHRALAPWTRAAEALFDLCEQVRCEALGARRFRGVAGNLVACHRARLRKSDLLNAHLASLIPLGGGAAHGAARQPVGAAIPRSPPPASGCGTAGCARASPPISWRSRESASDQAAFAALSRNFIAGLIEELGSIEGRERRFRPTADAPGPGPEDGRDRDRLTEDEHGDIFEPGGSVLPDAGADPLARLLYQERRPQAPAYAPFTTAHDLIIRSSELVDPTALRKERAALEQAPRRVSPRLLAHRRPTAAQIARAPGSRLVLRPRRRPCRRLAARPRHRQSGLRQRL